MKVKVSEASGAVLDWMVAKCEGIKLCLAPFPGAKNFVMVGYSSKGEFATSHQYLPTTSWAQGGPIIDREKIAVWPDHDTGRYFASADEGRGTDYSGDTLLIAALRCCVASKLGDEVEVPDEVLRNV